MSDSSTLTMEQVVTSIEFCFDHHLPKGVLFETPQEKTIIKTYRYFYKGLSVWLDHLVLRERLNPEAIFTSWQYFQPHAQIYAAYLDLLTGVHPRSFLSEHFESPLQAWASLVYLQSKELVSNSGLLGLPVICGKSELSSNNLERLERLDDREITLVPPVGHEAKRTTRLWHESPEDYLSVLASDIAEQDPNFDEEYWIPYRKALRRWERKIRDCKKLQTGCLLPSGELFVTGKGQKIPKQIKETKGFGHKGG